MAVLTPSGAARRFMRLDVEAQPGLLVERMRGREAINEDCLFELLCLSHSAFIEPRSLIGRPASLQLATADGSRRRWHGHVTRASFLGADGGFARYGLRLESALAFLKHRRNTLIFQNQTALEIVERVFANYPELIWRREVSATLRRRAICTQYREDDFAFVTRLLAEEGLSYRIEHQQRDLRSGPAHAVVIFDRGASRALPDGHPARLRFHRVEPTESADGITAFAEGLQVTSDTMTASSWAAEQVQAVAASVAAPPGHDRPTLPALERFDGARTHAFDNPREAHAYAQHQLDAERVGARYFRGQGSVRTLNPGRSYTLTAHPTLSGQPFVALVIEHRATNNLRGYRAIAPRKGDAAAMDCGNYRNRFLAIPAGVPIAPRHRNKPTAQGCQSAIVVGRPGQSLTGTRDHQVRIQFHWQRGTSPLPGGLNDTGARIDPGGHAPGDASSGTWVRVAEARAGANYGQSFVPRVGNEVLVEFDAGDIDQPVVIGSLYNGSSPPPFATRTEGDPRHAATVSGIRTQDTRGGPSGRWTLDDADGRLGQRLHHSLADSQLRIGHLADSTNGASDGRRGEGFELTTQGWAVLRSGEGLLLSSAVRSAGRSTQMDARGAIERLKAAEAIATGLVKAATAADAFAPHGVSASQGLTRRISPEEDGRYRDPVGGQAPTKPQDERHRGGAPVERFDEPALLMESPESIAVTTARSSASFAGRRQHLAVGGDAHLAAGATVATASGGATGVYAREGGMKIVANRGPVAIEAHAARMRVVADRDVRICSTTDRLDVVGGNRIVLQANGATVSLHGPNLSFACPGNFAVRSTTHRWMDGEGPGAPAAARPTGHGNPRASAAERDAETLARTTTSGDPRRIAPMHDSATPPGSDTAAADTPPQTRPSTDATAPELVSRRASGGRSGPHAQRADAGSARRPGSDEHASIQGTDGARRYDDRGGADR